MTIMTPAAAFLNRAHAIERAQEEDLDEFLRQVTRYVDEQYGVGSVEILFRDRSPSEGTPFRAWKARYSWPRDGLAGYAFENNRRLWLTAADYQPITSAGVSLVDHWSASDDDLPPLVRHDDNPTISDLMTTVLIPVRIPGSSDIIVAVFDSAQKLEVPSKAVKDEFLALAQSLAIMIRVWTSSDLNAREAQDALRAFASEWQYLVSNAPRLEPYQLFLAYSDRVNTAGIEALKSRLKLKWEEQHNSTALLEIKDWKIAQRTEFITQGLLQTIHNSDYFVGILSDKLIASPDESILINENVLLELGAFVGRTGGIGVSRCLLLRCHTTRLPFDIDRIKVQSCDASEGRLRDWMNDSETLGQAIDELFADTATRW